MVSHCLWGLCLEIDGRVGQGPSGWLRGVSRLALFRRKTFLSSERDTPPHHCPAQALLFVVNMKFPLCRLFWVLRPNGTC